MWNKGYGTKLLNFAVEKLREKNVDPIHIACHVSAEQIKHYCLSKHKAYEEHPFGDVPICYKLNGKIFAQLYPYAEDFKTTLKCTADAGQFYRMVYPGQVVRGYHCPPVQQPYWNTIYLEDFPKDELLNMIDHAYDTVLHSFSKKVQREIVDVVVRPEYQGQGIGSAVIDMLLAYVDDMTPPGGRSSVQLLSEKGKEGFYQKKGFKILSHEWCGAGMRKVIRK